MFATKLPHLRAVEIEATSEGAGNAQRMLFVVPGSTRSISRGGNKIGEGRSIGEGGSDSEIEAM